MIEYRNSSIENPTVVLQHASQGGMLAGAIILSLTEAEHHRLYIEHRVYCSLFRFVFRGGWVREWRPHYQSRLYTRPPTEQRTFTHQT